MRLSRSAVANAIAWAALLGLIGIAFVMVVVLEPFGLVILGLLILFVCTSVDLREDTPTWGTEVFKARVASQGSPEERAAMIEEKVRIFASLRFYRRCGIVLLLSGSAGFAW